MSDSGTKQAEKAKARAERLDKAIILAEQCRRVLKMKAFMAMIQQAIDLADEEADKSLGQTHDRHVGGKKFGRDLIEQINQAAKFTPPDQKPPAPPQYE